MRWLSIAVALAGLLSANPEEKHQKKPRDCFREYAVVTYRMS